MADFNTYSPADLADNKYILSEMKKRVIKILRISRHEDFGLN